MKGVMKKLFKKYKFIIIQLEIGKVLSALLISNDVGGFSAK